MAGRYGQNVATAASVSTGCSPGSGPSAISSAAEAAGHPLTAMLVSARARRSSVSGARPTTSPTIQTAFDRRCSSCAPAALKPWAWQAVSSPVYPGSALSVIADLDEQRLADELRLGRRNDLFDQRICRRASGARRGAPDNGRFAGVCL
ncbi:hypothetical protein [Nocardia sp. alder85J]|uniref:hypothetical protein n=1 Tax=Nocardia sp. alder85J TaxID=2862949 RepID=UPI001CD6CCB8|nr:hypothetical protein [Nocardia sp. alder85J]MCX4094697.1 hypothetical protein [Nocardia sp. alder85J]